MLDRLTGDQIDEVLTKLPAKRAEQIITVLSRLQPFADAWGTPLGQELLADAVAQTEMILGKVLDNKDDADDRALIKAYKAIIARWSEKINNYLRNVNQVKGEIR